MNTADIGAAPLTRERMVRELRALGVRPGDTLFVHSSYRSLGNVEGGAETVIRALEDALGPEGLLLLPSFNLVEGGYEGRAKTWNIATTRSTVGWITELARTMPGTFRSNHYSHSVAARGKDAERYVADHLAREGLRSPWDREPWGYTYGDSSPMLKAYRDPRGKVLMLGVDYHSSTYCHLVETLYWNELLQRDPKADYRWINREEIGAYWDSLGRLTRGRVGEAECRLFAIRDFVDTLLEAFRHEPDRWVRRPSATAAAATTAVRTTGGAPIEGRTSAPGVDYVSIAPATPDHPRNDSATVVQLPDDSLMIAWIEMHASPLGGHDEAPSSIASMRSSDGGHTWGEHRIEASPRAGDKSVYNPSLLRLANGDILFLVVVYHHLVWTEPLVASGILRRSTDGGRTFGPPAAVWDHLPYGGANNTLIQLSNGRIVKPVESVTVWGGPKDNHLTGCYYSDDNGHSWVAPTSWIKLPLRGGLEGHAAETRDGRLLMAMRTQIGSIFISESSDGGVTWSKPQTSGLRAPESMPCLVRIPGTRDLLMIWNHSFYDVDYNHFGKRTPLTSAISRDEGRSWANLKNLEDDPGVEFSNIACSFTRQRKAIVTYFTSRMLDPNPPGKLGRSAMSLKGAILDVEWFYR